MSIHLTFELNGFLGCNCCNSTTRLEYVPAVISAIMLMTPRSDERLREGSPTCIASLPIYLHSILRHATHDMYALVVRGLMP